jgi:hypothetical protein
LRRALAAAALACLAGGAAAEGLPGPRVTAEAFAAETEGLTLRFESGGRPHGAEQYLPGREVIWQDVDGACRRGVWRPEGGAICFLYELDFDGWTCWDVWREDGALAARPVGSSEGTAALKVSGVSERPLVCGDVDVGS